MATQSYSQQVTGYIYDQEGRVPNFTLQNTTQDLYSNSNSEGFFQIRAVLGDTIVLKSMAYKTYAFEVNKSHLKENIVLELEPDELKEVVVLSSTIDIKKLNDDLNKEIKNDINNNPTYYAPSKGNIGNLIYSLIGLFKKEGKSEKQSLEERKLSTTNFNFLFKNDEILNCKFLTEELRIPEKYHSLFSDYLDSKELSYTYLEKEKKLELIDLIYKYGKEYQSVINGPEEEDKL